MKSRFLLPLLALLAFPALNYGQDSVAVKKIRPDPLVRFGGFYPIALGDNLLKDAYSANPGLAVNMSFVSIYDFHLGAGGYISQFSNEKPALAGDFRNANNWGIYGFVSYELPLNSKFSLWPEVGVGYTRFRQFTGSTREAIQEGVEFRAGLFLDYKITPNFALFTGATYQGADMNVTTNPAFEDYYGKFRKVSFCLGLQIEAKPRLGKGK